MASSLAVIAAPLEIPEDPMSFYENIAERLAAESGSNVLGSLLYDAEFRRPSLSGHVERMTGYCRVIGRALGLGEERSSVILTASALHDIGNVGIDDGILTKPGLLTADERTVLERHTSIGHRMLLDSGSELLDLAAVIAWTHHERFDGEGYPQGLVGESIPLEGRIAHVADVFDALRSDKAYRPAFPLDDAMEILEQGRGTHFDPQLLNAFAACETDILAIERATVLEHATGGGAS
jgi:putative two-component system response regulator